MKNKIYKVTTEDGIGGSNFLGHATGEKEDILKYFEPKKLYNLHLEGLNVKEVTPEIANATFSLIDEKKALAKRMKEIDELLNS